MSGPNGSLYGDVFVELVVTAQPGEAALVAARARGRLGGRRPKLSPQQQAAIVDMVHTGRQSQADAARLFRVHPATGSRLLTAHRQPA